MKKNARPVAVGLALALTLLLTLTACPSGNGGGGSEAELVADLTLDGKVTAPERGAQPDTRAIDEAQYTGAVVWQTADGTAHSGAFAASTVYQAVVTLTAKSGHTFAGLGANSFSYAGATSVTNPAGSGIVTITFPATAAEGQDAVVNALSLNGKVTAPARGAQPNTTAINETQYTGTVAWQTAEGSPHTGAFAASTVYQAVINLTAKSGYTFVGLGTNSFSYAGATSVTNAAGSGTVTITFPATAAEGQDTVVNALSLNGLITAPVRDAQPVATAINETQYTGTVAWQTAEGSPHTDAFAASTVYQAVINLTAKSGYTFVGLGTNSFSYAGATSVANAAGSGTVTITFPATAAEGQDTVANALSLNGLITAPARDAQPVATAIDEVQYTGSVAWQTAEGSPHSGAFAASTVYRVVVYLTAKSGYTFAGLEANSFSYAGATSVTNAAGSGVVTITFPATAAEDQDTMVNALSLNGLITAPARGAQPDTGAIDEAQYTGTVAWQTAEGTAHSGAFAASTVYRAVVGLTAKSGYTFAGLGTNSFSYAGATSVTNAAGSGVVTITFPATDQAPGTVVSALSLDGLITAPEWDAQPNTGLIDETQYTGTVTWQTAEGSSHSGAFTASTVYRAVVTLTAKSGLTFVGLGENSFSYAGATSVTNAADSGVVTITFPATAELDPNVDIPIGTPSTKLYLDGATTPLTQNGKTTISVGAGTVTISIGPGYSEITWHLNGTVIAQGKPSIVLSKRSAGTYLITVEAVPNGGAKQIGVHTFVVQ
jgi:hypothetical protein